MLKCFEVLTLLSVFQSYCDLEAVDTRYPLSKIEVARQILNGILSRGFTFAPSDLVMRRLYRTFFRQYVDLPDRDLKYFSYVVARGVGGGVYFPVMTALLKFDVYQYSYFSEKGHSFFRMDGKNKQAKSNTKTCFLGRKKHFRLRVCHK